MIIRLEVSHTPFTNFNHQTLRLSLFSLSFSFSLLSLPDTAIIILCSINANMRVNGEDDVCGQGGVVSMSISVRRDTRNRPV